MLPARTRSCALRRATPRSSRPGDAWWAWSLHSSNSRVEESSVFNRLRSIRWLALRPRSFGSRPCQRRRRGADEEAGELTAIERGASPYPSSGPTWPSGAPLAFKSLLECVALLQFLLHCLFSRFPYGCPKHLNVISALGHAQPLVWNLTAMCLKRSFTAETLKTSQLRQHC